MPSPYTQERAHFRVKYPIDARPRLIVEGRVYDVIDCSEGGVLYFIKEGPIPEKGSAVRGRIRFKRGEEVEIAGEVVRVQNELVAWRLTEARIPLATIIAEQRYLRAHYPQFSF
jgi:hypothetical protein